MNIGRLKAFRRQRAQAVNPSVSASRAEAHPESGSAAEGAASLFREPCQNKKIPSRKMCPQPTELPKDVVEVHQDPGAKDQIIIRYLDKGKDAVLQMPSNEELSVERAIAQREAKEKKTHGD